MQVTPYSGRRNTSAARSIKSGSTRSRALVAAAIAVVAAAVAPGAAHAATLQLSPSGSDSNPCTSISPCASMNRAYSVAQPGDVVRLAHAVAASRQRLLVPGGDAAKRAVRVAAARRDEGRDAMVEAARRLARARRPG